jgi:glycosyltransferase involved in cell wall biosynthesis
MTPHSVAVIIPTTGRRAVLTAVSSVLEQSVKAKEIIVVFDGSEDDPHTEVLRALPSEVCVLFTGRRTNGNNARNIGVASASSDLVAFLDDDDVWHEKKLSEQLRHVPSGKKWWLQTTSVRVVDGHSKVAIAVWPGRGPTKAEPLGEYFFARERLRQRPRFLQTSTWLGPRELFIEHPFDVKRSIHQDWDWMIRAQASVNLDVVHLSEPLVSYTRNLSGSTSASRRYMESRSWVLDTDLPISARARGDFIVHMLLTRALREGLYTEARNLPKLARRRGAPSFWGLMGARLRLVRHRLQRKM